MEKKGAIAAMTGRAGAMRWIVSLATLAIGALTAWQCVRIQTEGAFTAEIVRERLRPMLPVLAAYAALAVAAGLADRNSAAPERSLRRKRDCRRDHRRRNVCVAAIAAVCAAMCLIGLLNGAERTMEQRLLCVGPWAALGFVAAAVLDAESGTKMPGAPARAVGAARMLLYAAAAAFIVLGAMNGGLRDVLVKAGNLCTECIGLG